MGRLASLPALVAFVVLSAGARLIFLSAEHHAALARESAKTVVADSAKKIESQLKKLYGLAGTQAEMAARVASPFGKSGTLPSMQPQANTFWMTADDQALTSSKPVIAREIASEWRSAEAGGSLPQSAVLGPMRVGSAWLLAIRIPITPGNGGTARGWAVAYAELDEISAQAQLGHLAHAGYDFEILRNAPRSAVPRVFVNSRGEPLVDTIAAPISLPTSEAVRGSYLELAIHPRTGWFPPSLLLSEIALLAFLTWLLAFATHELIYASQRATSALGASRRRVHSIKQQLASEMQQRLSLQTTFDHARFHDTFTGLPNRRYFMDQLDRALRDVRTKRLLRIAVVIVDISRIKLINHLLGHTAGDDLMVQIARRFEDATSALEGTLARWDGNQFALLLLDVASPEAALESADRVQEQLRPPFNLRRHQLSIAATLGVTCVESGQERAEDIMREADIALSSAKRQETTKALLYAPDMGGRAADLVCLDADLYLALQKKQLRLLFQPIVDLATRKMVGAEALLRWQHPVEGLLTPDRFLRHAEESGLMTPITRWIIQSVISVAADWRRHLPADQTFFISSNLSPSALRDPGLDEHVAALLREQKLPAGILKFELTELALVGNVAGARETLGRLHDLGIQLVLDDFGTGYSSLNNLQLFPFDFVKIDCPFVDRRGVFQANMSMVAAMIQLAGSLGLYTIAEIVECEAAAVSLKAMGCRYGQGYFFSEPVEPGLALERLRSQASFETVLAAADTVVESPNQQDGPDTLVIRRIPDTAGQDPLTAETRIIRALKEDTVMVPFEMLDLPDEDARESASPRPQDFLDAATAETIRTGPLEEQDLREAGTHDCDALETRPIRPLEEATVTLPFEMLDLPDEDARESARLRPQAFLDAATAETIRTGPLEEQDLREAGTRDCDALETRPVRALVEATVVLPFETIDLPDEDARESASPRPQAFLDAATAETIRTGTLEEQDLREAGTHDCDALETRPVRALVEATVMLPFETIDLPDDDTLRETGTRDCRAPVRQEWSTSRTRPVRPLEEATAALPFEMLDLPHGRETDEDE
jgi:diguanylate cyclase (GGDEF)-like protein